MPVLRNTMLDLITRVRMMIADPIGPNMQFQDTDIQDYLDMHRDDIRYEGLTIAPSIVNKGGTSHSADIIFADYYSKYGFWEQDVVLQGQGPSPSALPWLVLSPAASDYIVGRFQFEIDVFNSGVVPGQLPPVFATGKVYDLYATCADLLEFWSAALAGKYDVSVDGQTLKRSQLMQAKINLANQYRRRAKPKLAKAYREDLNPQFGARRMRLLDSDDIIKGA